MNWLIDFGNTRLKCAPLDNGRCGPVQAFAASDREALDGLLRILGSAKTGDRVWLASVGALRLMAVSQPSLGSLTSARASDNRRFMPPDKV